MKLATFLSIVGVVSILFGIGFVAAPAEVLAQYGITADDRVRLLPVRAKKLPERRDRLSI